MDNSNLLRNIESQLSNLNKKVDNLSGLLVQLFNDNVSNSGETDSILKEIEFNTRKKGKKE